MKRQATYRLHFVQARRISCVLCKENYTYLLRNTGSGMAEANVVFSDDAELQREAKLKALAEVERACGPQPMGRARCPHCHLLQPWMHVTPMFAVGVACVVLAIVCLLVAFVVAQIWNWPTAGGVAGALALPGLILVALAPRMADKPGPQPEDTEDPGYTDARFMGMLEENPSLRNWALAQGLDLDPKVQWLNMGLLDLGEAKLPIPKGLSSEACLAALNRVF